VTNTEGPDRPAAASVADTAPERAADVSATVATSKAGAKDVLKSLGDPRVLATLLVGFGSGLPFLLTAATFGYWLGEHGVTLAAIGFLSWVGLAYSFKFLWAPLVDKMDAPLLGWLGRRRSWMLLSYVVVGGGLVAMGVIGPEGGLVKLSVAALVVAFGSATLDIVSDAWRIEKARNDEELGLLTSAFQLGYRIAILAANALIFYLATAVGWNLSYVVFGVLMVVPLAAAMLSKEPASRDGLARADEIWTARGLYDAVVNPFVDFFRRHGQIALLMLFAITLYRLADFVMGPMAGPFYVDLGLEKPQIANVRLTFGLAATFVGIALAGLSAIRLGFGATLLLGAFLAPASNLGYAVLATAGLSMPLFSAVLFVENFSEAFAGTALVAYMSSLTSLGYTATQYALLSSFWSMSGKILKGFSGVVVENLQAATDQMTGYALFFAGTAAIAAPSFVLCWFLAAHHKRVQRGDPSKAAPVPA
jgi:PAT family beta-lactamase induction signal transducer AmpG